jgi:hypothetical protein
MKSSTIRQLIHALILVIALVLMIAGIITGKHGATVIGIIAAGVSVQQWLQWNKKTKSTENQSNQS